MGVAREETTMAKLTNGEFKFYIGQIIEVADRFVLDYKEYHKGQFFVIKKITKNCFVASDGHKVSKVWVDDDLYFTSDFILEHFKPSQLELFHSVLRILKEDENAGIHDLEVIKKEADVMSAFFGSEILEKSRVEYTRENKISEIENGIRMLQIAHAYYAAMDIAVQRWLIHCEESGVKYEIDNTVGDKLTVKLDLFDAKVIEITVDGIHYGEPSISDDNILISFENGHASKTVVAKYCGDRMKRAIQLSILKYLQEAVFSIEDRND
jgi:hypothetical protein